MKITVDREVLLALAEKKPNFYWSRAPGKVVDMETGQPQEQNGSNAFGGSVQEWYETLFTRIQKATNGKPCLLFCGPDSKIILENTRKWFLVYNDTKGIPDVEAPVANLAGYQVFNAGYLPDDCLIALRPEDQTVVIVGKISS